MFSPIVRSSMRATLRMTSFKSSTCGCMTWRRLDRSQLPGEMAARFGPEEILSNDAE